MKIFGIHFLTTSQVAALKAFGMSELDKAVAAAKQTELGAAVVAVVKAVEDPSLTGVEKMAKALAAVMPTVLDYASRGGFAGVLADTEAFARQLIESTLSDVKATSTVSIATAILRALGIK